MKSPFKFLDAYTITDRNVFFGRDQEITELYRRVFESKMLLVYGISGTGKSSLVNCGLASRFDESDWLPVNVRRGNNINDSLNDAFNKQALITLKKDQSTGEKLQSIYLDHFKPVYLLFDQFEELFIFGSQEEKSGFISIVKEITESEVQCRIIFIIREEFLAGMTEFESELPDIFTNRFRVEKMKRTNAISAVEGPCKVFGIETEQGFSEELIDKLCPAGNEIELTYLQIYLDRIFRLAVNEYRAPTLSSEALAKEEQPAPSNIKFSKELLTRSGSVSDLLGQFLDEQVREMDDPETGMSVLKSFVSIQGTRRQMNEREIKDSIGSFGTEITESELLNYLTRFVDLRILRERDEAGHFELRHDALASKIYEKFTAIEKDIIEVSQFIENAWHNWQKRNVMFSGDDLEYIAPYESRLYLSKELSDLIEKSKDRLVRTKRRRRNIAVATSIALIVIFAGFTIWALSERRKSDINYLKARANSFNLLSQKVVEKDPTIALHLAEYALSLDSANSVNIENINRIYYDNNFYKIISKQEGILSVAISPDGKSILTGSLDKTARLWNLQGNILQLYKGHEDEIYSVAFSPDGKSILTGSLDKTARLWDLQGNVLQEFKGHTDGIHSVAFSSNGKNILTGSMDRTARLWDLQGNALKVLKGHEEAIYSVAFSPDCKYILTGSLDRTARLWDLMGNVLQVYKGHSAEINAVTFSPDEKNILTGSMDRTARLWDLKGNVLQEFKGHEDGIHSVAFSPDGRNILTGSEDKTARLWDLQGNMLQLFKGHDLGIISAAFPPDGKSILTGSYDNTIRLWDLQETVLKVFKGHESFIFSVAFSPNGENILSGSMDGTTRLWDLQGNVIQIFTGHKQPVFSVAFSPDGRNILTGSWDGTAILWDLQGDVIQVFNPGTLIFSVAFSPDGRNILTGSSDGIARLWDLQGNVLQEFKGHEALIFSVAFSPDGKSVLTGSEDKTARLWDLQGKVLQVFRGHEVQIVSVAFSPDGKNILTGLWDNTARLWDLQRNVLQVFKGHEEGIFSVAFSPDCKNILTGSYDNTIRLWDLQGNMLQVFRGHKDEIMSVAFSPDAKYIISGSRDKTVILWEPKKSLTDFLTEGSFDKLSISKQLEFGIIDYKDIASTNDLKIIEESAKYYAQKAIQFSGDKTGYDCLNKAIFLYENLLSLNTIVDYSLDLSDAYLTLYYLKPDEKIKIRIDEVNNILNSMLTKDNQLEVLNYYMVKCDVVDSLDLKFLFPQRMISISDKAINYFPERSPERNEIALLMSELSFRLILKAEFNLALRAILLAVKADENYENSYTNLPLAYLLNNQYQEAEKIYVEWENKPFKSNSGYKTYRDAFLADLVDLEDNGITHPDFEKVRELLKK